MNIDSALLFLDHLILQKSGATLRAPEKVILRGSWDGLTYEQMANASEYSINYLMRDIGPKLWKSLSDIFEEPIGKGNFRVVLEELKTTSDALPFINQQESQRKIQKSDRTEHNSLVKSATSLLMGEQVSDEDKSIQLALSTGPSWLPRTQLVRVAKSWILKENVKIVGIWGLGGVGKTFLAHRIVDQIKGNFESAIWCDLKQATSFDAFLALLPAHLWQGGESSDRPTETILTALKAKRYLLIFDGIDSILESNHSAGFCQPAFEELCKLVKQIGQVSHQSCLMLTGPENLKDLSTIEGQQSSIRSLYVGGISHSEARSMLAEERLASQESWDSLIDLYHGHPLALKAASNMIRNLFGGNVAEFIHHNYVVFDAIEEIFEPTLRRLSDLEKELLYWLVSEGKPATLNDIQAGISPMLYPTEILEGLESLKRRFLIEVAYSQETSQFSVPTVLSQCVLRQYVRQVRGNCVSTSSVFGSPQLQDNWIQLHPSPSADVHLSNWFKQMFEPDWQPLDLLFNQAQAPVARMRSTLHLRGEDMIKRFKQIYLGAGNNAKPVVMLVAISREGDELTSICVQAQPAGKETNLPKSLHLLLRDGSDTPLAEVQSHDRDSFIQLPYFRGEPKEVFSIQLSLDDFSYTEKFVV